jgi:hypothetical protein
VQEIGERDGLPFVRIDVVTTDQHGASVVTATADARIDP